MAVLSFQDHYVRQLRRSHPALRNAKVVGRGSFSGVFATSDTARVVKLTADRAHVEYLVDPYSPQGPYKPQVFENHGVVGETDHGVSLYLLEMEHLQKIQSGTANKGLVRIISRFFKDSGSYLSVRYPRLPQPEDNLKGLPLELAMFMEELNQFVGNFACKFDIHGANFMQRADGTLILSDPVYDSKIYNQMSQLRRRAA